MEEDGTVVAPREGCVSRNDGGITIMFMIIVAPREGCVSRNAMATALNLVKSCRTPRGVCE